MWLLVKLRQESANRRTYLFRMRFQRKVAGIVEMDFGTRVVALERFGAQGQEKPGHSCPKPRASAAALSGNIPGTSSGAKIWVQ
jgi:hypothetical protein